MTGNRVPRPCPPAPARSPGERDPTPHKDNQSCFFRLDHDRAHDVGVKATPLRGGLRPAWTPPPHTRASTHWPETRPKQRSSLKNKDLTGPAPSWMTWCFGLTRLPTIAVLTQCLLVGCWTHVGRRDWSRPALDPKAGGLLRRLGGGRRDSWASARCRYPASGNKATTASCELPMIMRAIAGVHTCCFPR
jgi:hypothetical protein